MARSVSPVAWSCPFPVCGLDIAFVAIFAISEIFEIDEYNLTYIKKVPYGPLPHLCGNMIPQVWSWTPQPFGLKPSSLPSQLARAKAIPGLVLETGKLFLEMLTAAPDTNRGPSQS